MTASLDYSCCFYDRKSGVRRIIIAAPILKAKRHIGLCLQRNRRCTACISLNRIAGAQAKAVAVGHVHHIRIGGIIRHLNTVNNTSEEVIKLRLLNDLDLNGIRFSL